MHIQYFLSWPFFNWQVESELWCVQCFSPKFEISVKCLSLSVPRRVISKQIIQTHMFCFEKCPIPCYCSLKYFNHEQKINYTFHNQLGSLGHFTFNFGYGKAISIFSQNSSKFLLPSAFICFLLLSSSFIFSELDIMMRNVDYLLVLYHDRKKRSQKGWMTSQPQHFQRWNIKPWIFFQPQNFQPRYFNHKLLKPRLYNYEHLKPLGWRIIVEKFMVEMSGF